MTEGDIILTPYRHNREGFLRQARSRSLSPQRLPHFKATMNPDKNLCHGDLDALASDRSRRGTVMGVRTGEPENRVLMDWNVRTRYTSQFVRADNSKNGRMRQTQLDIAETDFARRIADLDAASAHADILTTPVVFGQIHITRQAPNP